MILEEHILRFQGNIIRSIQMNFQKEKNYNMPTCKYMIVYSKQLKCKIVIPGL